MRSSQAMAGGPVGAAMYDGGLSLSYRKAREQIGRLPRARTACVDAETVVRSVIALVARPVMRSAVKNGIKREAFEGRASSPVEGRHSCPSSTERMGACCPCHVGGTPTEVRFGWLDTQG